MSATAILVRMEEGVWTRSAHIPAAVTPATQERTAREVSAEYSPLMVHYVSNNKESAFYFIGLTRFYLS